jgi:hypothetical protein
MNAASAAERCGFDRVASAKKGASIPGVIIEGRSLHRGILGPMSPSVTVRSSSNSPRGTFA